MLKAVILIECHLCSRSAHRKDEAAPGAHHRQESVYDHSASHTPCPGSGNTRCMGFLIRCGNIGGVEDLHTTREIVWNYLIDAILQNFQGYYCRRKINQ